MMARHEVEAHIVDLTGNKHCYNLVLFLQWVQQEKHLIKNYAKRLSYPPKLQVLHIS